MTVVLIALVLLSALALLDEDLAWIEWDRCRNAAFSCGIVAGLLVTLIPLGLAWAFLMLWQVERVRDRYRSVAQEKPHQLVEAAGDLQEVVGRNDLCTVLKMDLEDTSRRPHVLVGGVGVGKTAVLVQLTRLLAESGAIPVPIRLRASKGDIDFNELARQSFRRVTESWVSPAEADKIWLKLRSEGEIVVLADGLEEAMQDNPARDTAIRVAVDEARRLDLPLVVASRPHDALSYLDAAVLRLEPLSEKVACDYIVDGADGQNESADRIRRIVERAEVVEAPLYMQVARELHEAGELERVNTRHAGRIALRAGLLEAWTEQLIAGKLVGDVALVTSDRRRAVSTLGALACVGLRKDSLEVDFSDCKGLDDDERIEDVSAADVKFAAGAGARLGIVEALPDAVRFRHSIMQAYLGSRRIGDFLRDPEFLAEGLSEPGPGREFLMALAMHFALRPESAEAHTVLESLLKEADDRPDAKSADLLAAAAEIDHALYGCVTAETVKAIRGSWRDDNRDEASVQSKLAAVARLGETGATLAGRTEEKGHPAAEGDAFAALWHIAMTESAYPVRLLAAQELGAGGKPAFQSLSPEFEKTLAEAERLYGDGRQPPLDALKERRFSLQGWILPLLIGSIEASDEAHAASDLLARWVALVGPKMQFSVEASLAQGFKYESNRRASRTAKGDAREFLMEQASTMLEQAHFWFSKISLLQALTLWAMRDHGEPAANARRRVESWVGRDTHVFVREAAELCVEALEHCQPSRFMWIDEMGVASKVGPSAVHHEWQRSRRLWISPAVGWLALDPRAQQLVGDIIILLNLAERAMDTGPEARLQREMRLRRAGLEELPPCLTEPGGRAYLKVKRAGEHGGGARAECMAGCKAQLCPLPPKGQRLFRGELSEPFCRSQNIQLAGRGGRQASWQRKQPLDELRDFWQQMEKRAQA